MQSLVTRVMGRRMGLCRENARLVASAIAVVVLLTAGCWARVATPHESPTGHWTRRTAAPVISSPAVADLDGDGQFEIVIGSWDGYLYLMDHRLENLPGWPQYSPKGFFASPTLADLDGDGRAEVIVGAESGKLHAWDVAGQAVAGFPLDLGHPIWASVVILDGPRIALADLGRMHLLDAQGRPAPGWPREIQGWADATAAHVPGLIAVTTLTPGDPSQGWLYAWTEQGALLAGFPVGLALDSDSSPALAQFDHDGRWWIVCGDDAGWLHVINTEGIERPGFPVRTRGQGLGPTPTPHPPGGNIHSIEASPALADLNGDGRLEIVVGSWDGQMYVWDDAGRILPGWPIQVQDQIISSAALADVDGDGWPDIIVGSKDGWLYGWSAAGEALPGFPYELGAPVFSSPWVGDLEADGRADIVVGANNGVHLLVDIGPAGVQVWPTFHQNLHRTGVGLP